MSEFFVPDAEPSGCEATYAALAEVAGVAVPAPGKRIQSITFRQDGIDWVAEVGQSIRGQETERRRRKAGTVGVRECYEDTAIVLAIFPGDPIRIVTDSKPTDAKPTDAKPTDAKPTDAKPISNGPSYWENPARVELAGLKTSKLFSA
jgi:hypothetical protein